MTVTEHSRLHRRTPRLVVAVALALAALVLPAAVAGAQDPSTAPTLGAVMEGGVPGLGATALSAFGGGLTQPDAEAATPAMQVEVTLDNAGSEPVAVAVPFGTLLATDDESDQTTATAGPTDDPTLPQVAASGGTPEVVAAPGTTVVMLTVYCAEMDDGAPFEPTPMHYAGMAADPLPTVLRNIAAQQPVDGVAQDAVWWVTDDPVIPPPAHVVPLLAGVDVEAFAAAPEPVIPDSAYVPVWERSAVLDESFDGGTSSGSGPVSGAGGSMWWLWALVAATVATIVVVVARRSGSPSVARAATRSRPGWYPDPWRPGSYRYWDGTRWR